ncbi:uncharacterized protein (DUF1501 family) [Catalinimonas alkaloidigena]|uniref:DUF1501 domain-containing protein n=1 Tax=Catalinimonas alkaloidigena TaxID=1075417 RepID=UPI0024068E2C|nr:DUF1501 domain-containing protein [Catalinimonas alkaloidigena]MDF9797656.1 uncharacterized protein (DUF1501 family) [Catalinimonas alkaloidigena]
MKRRKFLKNLSASGAAFMLNGMPFKVMAQSGEMQRLASSANNDRVLVIIQMHGGNDGLNTIIPINQYSQYYNLRPNIAIPDHGKRRYITLDSTLSEEKQAGIHPDMLGIKELYDQGKVGIVQGVAYENLNASHFRSRDIWFMGGDYDEYIGSGWMGRYLDDIYPGYPDAYPSADMPDPLGLEIGNAVSLAFHRANGIPTAVSVSNPEQFYNLITSVGGEPPESVADTHYGHELQWIMDIEKKSNQYAGRLKEVFAKGTNSPSVRYPETYPYNAPKNSLNNSLAPQLKMIARLLSGGCKTKIFLARIGGFDTHASQVESYDATMGVHAARLYHLSEAVKAFQNDLKGLGLEDRVLTTTMSEFGRRAASNGSWGTDHGTSAPMLIFGNHVKPGITGTNPDLYDLDRNNLRMQHDYRQVFGAIVQDWFEASPEAIQKTRFEDFVWNDQKLSLIGNPVLGVEDNFISDRYYLEHCTPNPASSITQVRFRINIHSLVELKLLNQQGRIVKKILREKKAPGEYKLYVDVSALPKGVYHLILQAGSFKNAKTLMVM